jgi:hypothetical protein
VNDVGIDDGKPWVVALSGRHSAGGLSLEERWDCSRQKCKNAQTRSAMARK